ncbi:hypothetical protein CC86DRAFT_414527 [Ophiobolus disseminans]|uniref:Uncharacterized protein n=1 Tax=Ophiobolus disseminans TaxID=1469910 RepID=A0A6A7AHT6_9PLEO|nr:hypothetical protein CC86DRAFT_414527 [Ophiobolus disseminans]
MLGESVFTDGLLQDQRVFFNALKLQIVESLLAAYPRHSSSNVLKGFSIRFTMHEGYFAVTAIAELGLPTSLSEGFDIVLEDNFMGAYSTNGFFDALEHLGEQVEHYLDEEEKNDTWGMETRISGEEYFSDLGLTAAETVPLHGHTAHQYRYRRVCFFDEFHPNICDKHTASTTARIHKKIQALRSYIGVGRQPLCSPPRFGWNTGRDRATMTSPQPFDSTSRRSNFHLVATTNAQCTDESPNHRQWSRKRAVQRFSAQPPLEGPRLCLDFT